MGTSRQAARASVPSCRYQTTHVSLHRSHQLKPPHLSRFYADPFLEQSVAQAYRFRPHYPPETFDLLEALLPDEPRTVLDIGCDIGFIGFIARNLVERDDRVDAVDMSAAMIETGCQLSNGRHANLRWNHAAVEEAPLTRPYGLVVAGQSLHWMDWGITLARVGQLLTRNGFLAIIELKSAPSSWDAEMLSIIRRYSAHQDFVRMDLVVQLQQRGLFEVSGSAQTQDVEFVQSIGDYVAALHSRNGFTLGRMTPANASAFDESMTGLVGRYCADGVVRQMIQAQVTCGRPSSHVISV